MQAFEQARRDGDRHVLLGIVDGWLLDLDTVRTWTRNPMIYAAAISDGVHNLMTMESSPAERRMQQATAKLRSVPQLLASARDNVRDPPRVFVDRAITMLHGTSDLLAGDLPLAFAARGDQSLRRALTAAADTARNAVDGYAKELASIVPKTSGDFRVGTANVEARYRAEELIDLPAPALLEIGERELKKTEAEFAAAAARIDPARTAIEVWREVLLDHPKRGELVAAAQRTVDELFAFISSRHLIDLPPGERVIVAAAPEFD